MHSLRYALEKLTQATKLKRLNHTRPGTTEQAQLDRIPKVDTDIETVKPIKSVAPAAVALKIDPKDHVQILLDDFLSDAPEHVKNNYRVAIRDGNPYIARRDQSVSDQLQYVDGQIVFASNKIDIPNQVLERLKVDHQSLSPEARKKLKELEAVRNQAVAKRDAALKSGNAEHLKEAYQDMRAASEELGEEAARIFVEQNYPGAKSLSAKLITKGKQGQFDQIYQTEDGRLLVIEAKGGSATWGSRMAGKDRAQQGSRAYMESIFENYKDKLTEYKADPKYDDPKESKFNEQVKELSKMLDKYEIALDMKGVIDNPIEYIGIQQKASDSGIKEVMNITIFDIDY